ncbi:MFS transporter [candidate division KSB1 bacterium]|nr:MFS transporter [candidate division KSB1 bacterium]
MISNKHYRLFIFGALYFVQGAVLSYFITFNILYLREFGFSKEAVGFFQSILAVPFILKIFFGMASDAWNPFNLGHRKPYIIMGLFLQGTAMYLITFVSPQSNLTAFAVMALLASIGMALYDTCTDGLALDTCKVEDRSIVQGVMTGGRAAGVLALLLLGGIIRDNVGWNWIFYIEAILAFTLIPLVLVLKEGRTVNKENFSWNAFKSFTKPAVIILSTIGIIYALTIDGIYTFLSDHLRYDFELSMTKVTMLIALAMAGRITGALSSSFLTRLFGRKPSVLIAIGLTITGTLILALGSSLMSIALGAFFFGLAYGYYTAIYGVIAMDFSDPAISASMFAIFMMFINIGTVIGQTLGGVLTQNLGFKGMSLIMGFINLINVFLVILLFRKRQSSFTSVSNRNSEHD